MPSNDQLPILQVAAIAGGVALLLIASSGFRGNSPTELSAQPKKVESVSPTEIVGEIRFAGTPPAVRTLDRSDEPACENGTAFVETSVVTDGLVANGPRRD